MLSTLLLLNAGKRRFDDLGSRRFSRWRSPPRRRIADLYNLRRQAVERAPSLGRGVRRNAAEEDQHRRSLIDLIAGVSVRRSRRSGASILGFLRPSAGLAGRTFQPRPHPAGSLLDGAGGAELLCGRRTPGPGMPSAQAAWPSGCRGRPARAKAETLTERHLGGEGLPSTTYHGTISAGSS